ncbi:MAG: hypothetical protein HY520_02210 [Candidatus Aenigmarchaeota archaeon]|nr:hypothetical protein [Candidatus Aenigmarchaeota archaeon]
MLLVQPLYFPLTFLLPYRWSQKQRQEQDQLLLAELKHVLAPAKSGQFSKEDVPAEAGLKKAHTAMKQGKDFMADSMEAIAAQLPQAVWFCLTYG